MAGYQEVLTDPSYAGQIVTMTYPHQGNYGINDEDPESWRLQVAGFAVREASRRAEQLARRGDAAPTPSRDAGVVGIEGIDTRQLTLRLRAHGRDARGGLDRRPRARLARRAGPAAPGMAGADLATTVSTVEPYERERRWSARRPRIGARSSASPPTTSA